MARDKCGNKQRTTNHDTEGWVALRQIVALSYIFVTSCCELLTAFLEWYYPSRNPHPHSGMVTGQNYSQGGIESIGRG